MRVLFLVNPLSGPRRDRGRLREAIGDFCHRQPGDSKMLEAGRREDLDSLLDDAEREGFGIVCAVGGDGTVSEIGTRLIGRQPALSILPIGSGNGFARHLGIALDPLRALEALPAGRVESIDSARVNDTPFLGVCGIGFDAVVAHRFAASSVRGLRTYVRAGFMTYISYRDEEMELVVSNVRRRASAFVLAVANSNQYGNGARIAPLASLQDGLLDVAIVKRPPLFAAPMVIQSLFRGTLNRSRYVESLQLASITVERTSEGPGHIDGEPITLPRSLVFEIVPRSLRVLVPAETGKI